MARPVLALLTDFGTRDHYAGTMKGVVLAMCPEATLVDIRHEIPPHDVLAGALSWPRATGTFPRARSSSPWSIPASDRRGAAIAAEAGDYRFVAPDNGVLTAVLRETPRPGSSSSPNAAVRAATVSRTFEGRDRSRRPRAGSRRGRPGRARAAGGLPVSHRLAEPGGPGREPRGTHPRRRSVRQPRHEHRSARRSRRFVGRTSVRRRSRWSRASAGRDLRRDRDDEVCALFGSSDCLELAAHRGRRPAARAWTGRLGARAAA